VITLLSLFFLGGCGPSFVVYVDSINNGQIPLKKTCYIISGVEDVEASDLQFKEFKAYIICGLAENGIYTTEDPDTAEATLLVAYGIGEPEEHIYSYSQPIYGQTGVSSSHTSGTVYNYGNTGTYSGTTTYTPSYGVVGAVPMTGSYITFTRWLDLRAVDMDQYKKDETVNVLWETRITSTGSSGDLRQVFPVLVAAASPHFGENTGKQIKITLHENDKVVKVIRGLVTQK
jgi:hypothetical protein